MGIANVTVAAGVIIAGSGLRVGVKDPYLIAKNDTAPKSMDAPIILQPLPTLFWRIRK